MEPISGCLLLQPPHATIHPREPEVVHGARHIPSKEQERHPAPRIIVLVCQRLCHKVARASECGASGGRSGEAVPGEQSIVRAAEAQHAREHTAKWRLDAK